jgi:hypothetical protein
MFPRTPKTSGGTAFEGGAVVQFSRLFLIRVRVRSRPFAVASFGLI